MIGKVLGNRYEILEEIGNGGMAKVYKARCRLLKRFVAVKVLRSEFAGDEAFLARFGTEAQAAAALSHQNIVGIYDVGREGSAEYIVMEYIEGKTLKDTIREHQMLPWQQAVDFAIQICRALHCAHRNGIVHRDIKPQNIILTGDGVLKVTDFGIARAATASSVTITGSTMGSVHYLSPEQARGGYTDAKSDIYSLGIVMYEMVTGKLPFEGDSAVTIAIKQIQEKPVSPKEYNVAVPLAVEAIILKAMNKDQAMRYATASDMLRDLETAKLSPQSAPAPAPEEDEGATKRIPVIPKGEAPREREPVRPKKEADEQMKRSEKKAILWGIVTSVVLVAALIVGTLAVVFPGIFGGGGKGETEVPGLVGKQYDQVKDAYTARQITLVPVDKEDDSAPEGEIIDQDPKAGRREKPPFTIEVTVARAPKAYVLESFVKKEIVDTRLALEKKNIVVDERSEENDEIPEGHIIRTEPAAGASLKAGDTVILYVSKGAGETTVPMPNLVGLDIQLARKMISDNKLLDGEVVPQYSDRPKGEVLRQSEDANSMVKTFTRINLTISQGPEPKTRPFTVTVPQEKETTHIKILQDGKVIHDQIHSKTPATFEVPVTGTGTVQLELYYDGVPKPPVTVTL